MQEGTCCAKVETPTWHASEPRSHTSWLQLSAQHSPPVERCTEAHGIASTHNVRLPVVFVGGEPSCIWMSTPHKEHHSNNMLQRP